MLFLELILEMLIVNKEQCIFYMKILHIILQVSTYNVFICAKYLKLEKTLFYLRIKEEGDCKRMMVSILSKLLYNINV
jgi:hypothetical protein